MTTRTITITIDVPDDMAASVNNEAYRAIEVINADVERRVDNILDSWRLLRHVTEGKERSPEVNETLDLLKGQRDRIHRASGPITDALSQISDALDTIESEWRRSQGESKS